MLVNPTAIVFAAEAGAPELEEGRTIPVEEELIAADETLLCRVPVVVWLVPLAS